MQGVGFEASAKAGAHFDELARLNELERTAEKEQRLSELERFSLTAREATGKTVARLTIDGVESGIGGYQRIILSRPSRADGLTPFHAMNRGDNVRLTFPEGTKPPFVDGTLDNVEEARVAVAVDILLPADLPQGRCVIDLIGSDATFRRMMKALGTVCRTKERMSVRLRDICMGEAETALGKAPALTFFDKDLNKWQKEAVGKAFLAEEISVVHGPPGTGKTTVLVEIIRQAVERGERVLASAPSNIAVDNILEKLFPHDLRVVRLGHPARMLESVQKGNIQVMTINDPQFTEVQEMDSHRERLWKKLNRIGTRSIEEQDRAAMKREVRRLWREARKMELAISRRLARSAQVVLATHGGLSDRVITGFFDWVIMDEASQATEPLSWIPLLKAGRVVLAGDPLQLPPTLFSKEAAEAGLSVTLLERLQKILPTSVQTLLRIQYRMNEKIMGFSSAAFYEGKLIAAPAVRHHIASELQGVAQTDLTSVPLVFIDTAGTGFEEKFDEVLQSRENRQEARLAVRIVESILAAGVDPSDIAVLTPYRAQKNVFRTLLRHDGIEIGTVDGFQGREKEATVVSLVRSNDRGEVGFLSDTRRMNVALTRARRLLIVLGDSATISHHPFYRDFLEYMQTKGEYRSAWEWAE